MLDTISSNIQADGSVFSTLEMSPNLFAYVSPSPRFIEILRHRSLPFPSHRKVEMRRGRILYPDVESSCDRIKELGPFSKKSQQTSLNHPTNAGKFTRWLAYLVQSYPKRIQVIVQKRFPEPKCITKKCNIYTRTGDEVQLIAGIWTRTMLSLQSYYSVTGTISFGSAGKKGTNVEGNGQRTRRTTRHIGLTSSSLRPTTQTWKLKTPWFKAFSDSDLESKTSKLNTWKNGMDIRMGAWENSKAHCR